VKARARAALACAAFGLAACPGARDLPPPSARLAAWEGAALEDGRPVRLEAAQGAFLLNVWAMWCEPCRREMASLEAAHRALAPRGIRVIGVNIDEDPRLAREFLRRQGFTFTNLADPAQALARGALGVTRLPTTIAVGPDGAVRWREESARDWSDPTRLAWIEKSLASEGRR